jgi:hypothetical protein
VEGKGAEAFVKVEEADKVEAKVEVATGMNVDGAALK